MRYDHYRKAASHDAGGTDAARRGARPAVERARSERPEIAATRRGRRRSRSSGGQPASHARRITLLSWFLVITLTLAVEGAWLPWIQDVWAAAPIEASPRAPADDVQW